MDELNQNNSMQYSGRIPPQAVDAETFLLGGLIQDPSAFANMLTQIKTEYFSLERHQIIWKTLIELYKENIPVDFVTLSAKLENAGKLETIGGKDYLLKLVDSVVSAANAPYHAELIREKAILRQLIDCSNLTIREAMEPGAESKLVMSSAEKRIFQLAESGMRDSLSKLGDLLTPLLTRIMERKEGLTGVNTGIPKLNTLTGGLQKSDLIVLAARPGVGKTSFALSLAAKAAIDYGETVAFFSLEMSGDQLLQRILSMRANVNLKKLRDGTISKQEIGDIHLACPQIAEAPIYVDDNSDLGITELMTKARQLKSSTDLKLIIIDYLQLMRTEKGENRAVQIGEISRGLKILAKDLQVPIIALAQLNRGVEEKGRGDPKLSDLRESGSIEQDADMVWFVMRDFKPNEEGIDYGKLIVAKHRNGSTGEIPLAFISKTTFFREKEDDEEIGDVYDNGFGDAEMNDFSSGGF